jgi:hypothetical protein
MFTLEGEDECKLKLKVCGFSGKENNTDLATSVDGSEYLLGYSAASFNPYNAAIVKEAYSSVTPS